jgi:hypothetical protein
MGNSALEQTAATHFTGLVRSREPIGDMPPRHIPRPTSIRALRYVPSGGLYAHRYLNLFQPPDCSRFMFDLGSESVTGITRRFEKRLPKINELRCASGTKKG